MGNKPLSMKEISKLSGVSTATVSRIINETGRYSAQTEKKVRQIIAEHNYIPNMAARSLRKSFMPIIGVIVPDINNEFFAGIVSEIQLNLFAKQFSTIICNTNESIQLEKEHLNFLKAQNVSGLIIISGNPSNIFSEDDLPIAYIDRKPSGINIENEIIVESDSIRGGYLAGKELIGRGCKKIAAIMDKRIHTSGMERYQGLMQAQIDEGVPIYKNLLVKITQVGFEAGYNGIFQLLEKDLEFDGVFCTTDVLALGAISALHDKKINVPEDVKVIGFDDISIAKYSFKPMSTIHQNRDIIAKKAVELLLKKINKENIEKKHHIIDVYTVVRESTKGKE